TNLSSVGTDGFIWKLSSSGSLVYARRIGGSSTTSPDAVALDPITGGLFLGGKFFGTTDFDPGSSTQNRTAGVVGSGFLLKLNSSGNFLFVDTLGASANVAGISLDKSGNVYSTGQYRGSTDFD